MRLSNQRPPGSGSCTAEPSAASAHWRYRAVPWRPTSSCAAQRTSTASAITAVSSTDPGSRSGTFGEAGATVVYTADINGRDVVDASEYSLRPVNNHAEAHTVLHEPESSLILRQQDTLGQCYSSATVSAMARLMGQSNDSEHLLAAGQTGVVVLPKARLLSVLKAGSGTPLDEASAALALLCEAGQYDAVVQYGNPLLKAASAAVPFSPLGAVKQQPVPHLEHLAADLALSIALAHISMAGGAPGGSGAGAGTGGGGGAQLAAGGGGGSGTGSMQSSELSGLEGVHAHLESALQVLERHSVAAAASLQQEVSYCLQGVAAAFAEEVLRTTPPVSPQPQPSAAAGGAGSGPAIQLAAGARAVAGSAGGGAPTGAAGAAGGAPGPSAAAATARRAKAISVLRSALWRGAAAGQHHNHQAQHSQSQQQPQQQQQQEGHGGAVAGAVAAGSAPVEAGGAPAGGGGGGGWAPELTPEERTELMAPLRGLLTASEHIALYGPVASGQKPYGAVKLSDEELYDLAIAHLAQGVSTGWPQHVLQALSYFERIAQQQLQQQHQQQSGGATAPPATAAATAAAAADVSFERSVCEALLGRRTSAAGTAAAAAAAASAEAGRTAAGGGSAASSASLPYSLAGDEWYDDGDESALLRRLEAQLLQAAGGVGGGATAAVVGALEGAVSFSVKERSDGVCSECEDECDAATGLEQAAAAAAAAAGTPAGGAAATGDKAPAAAATATQQPPSAGGRARYPVKSAPGKVSERSQDSDEVARKYGWAESWLELSVMPCFPETAGAGSVSLARWFADPRVILFNKLLAVRSGEAQVTAALGSAVAHVSDASRQRLWQLWQAAAHAVSAASKGHGQPQPPAAQAAAAAPAASEAVAAAGAGPKGGAGAPMASGLLAQSRAALQDVAPRAAAAANAVAAAAAAVGSAAARSPRTVARWMAPFNLGSRWGSAEKQAATGGGSGGGRAAIAAQALPRVAAAAAAAEPVTTRGDEEAVSRAAGSAGDRSYSQAVENHQQPQQKQQTAASNTNNVVPFPAGVAAPGGGGGGGGPGPAAGGEVMPSPPAAVPAAPPVAGGLVDVALAAPPASGSGSAADAAAAAGALWAPDAEGHLRPRPRMVARVVQRAAAAAVTITEHVAALPGAAPVRDWAAVVLDPAAADEATSREAVRRVAAVAAQAVCLGALAAYVGNRIVASGALQAAAASGYGAAAAAAAPTVDASRAQVAAAAAAVARWLGGGSAAQEALGQWPLLGGGGGGAAAGAGAIERQEAAVGSEVGADAASVESVSRLAEQYGRRAQLDEAAAAALLRGWAAARAAAPALADPRDRAELLSGLLGGRALKVARAEADRNARMSRRVQLQRIEVELEQLRARPVAAAAAAAAAAAGQGQGLGEVVVTAALVTAGTETSRVSPLPLSYCTRERLTLTFRREAPAAEGPTAAAVWRLVDVRDAPPAMY
ncbi:hypothetical protein PLESTB_001566400 [Pleodorina starrii]|uniref:Plastid division protein CDP1-like 2nd alpha solenoid domain-containing protein n=1 Tax=Pleodorina starrii TaxID=330485 RepID=A0A9W6BYU4_9CHLO|nr:hypothetical protein PLESTM_001482200 [Pleodorina starrii]GLC60036.1 hypothetical protein PLESTB_001566400 [Pleodorina starrii]GLC72739.1 hypothetical protein PLESTF_001287900 [Pleodorina starrii]